LQEVQDSLLQTNSEVATIQALQAKLQKQIDEMKELNTTVSDFIATLNVSELLYKDEFGNLDLGEGKMKAAEVSSGVFSINVKDEDAPTIGESVICPKMTDVDNDGQCKIDQIDKDNDNIDDNTNNPINNGRKVKIKTSA